MLNSYLFLGYSLFFGQGYVYFMKAKIQYFLKTNYTFLVFYKTKFLY